MAKPSVSCCTKKLQYAALSVVVTRGCKKSQAVEVGVVEEELDDGDNDDVVATVESAVSMQKDS